MHEIMFKEGLEEIAAELAAFDIVASPYKSGGEGTIIYSAARDSFADLDFCGYIINADGHSAAEIAEMVKKKRYKPLW